jgi:hypothetical protein
MGDSCAQGGKPGIKETGTPEDVPRTAAITHAAGIKKGSSRNPGKHRNKNADLIDDVRASKHI